MATTKRLPGFEFLGQPDIDMTGSIITNGSCAELCVRGILSVAAPRLGQSVGGNLPGVWSLCIEARDAGDGAPEAR